MKWLWVLLLAPSIAFAGVGTIEHDQGRTWNERLNKTENIDFKGPEHLFFFEAELSSQTIIKQKLQVPYPGMTWDDTLGNLKTLDQWRNAVGYSLAQD